MCNEKLPVHVPPAHDIENTHLFIYATWLIRVCDMTDAYVCHIHMCIINKLSMQIPPAHNIENTHRIQMCHVIRMRNMTDAYVRNIHMCVMKTNHARPPCS